MEEGGVAENDVTAQAGDSQSSNQLNMYIFQVHARHCQHPRAVATLAIMIHQSPSTVSLARTLSPYSTLRITSPHPPPHTRWYSPSIPLGMATKFEGVYYVLRHKAGIELGLQAHTVRCVTPSLSNRHALLQTRPTGASLLPPVFCPAHLSLIGHDTVVPASRATPSYTWPSVTRNVCTGARYSSHRSPQVGTRSGGWRALMRLRPHMHPRLGKCSG
jgi:hypothetical protein